MTYELRFRTSALKEWRKLDGTLREQFKKKLQERLEHPHVPASALSGMPDAYKIKLRQAGYPHPPTPLFADPSGPVPGAVNCNKVLLVARNCVLGIDGLTC